MSERTPWLESGEYLPPWLRDFHEQKDLFKAIHDQYRLYEPKDHRDPINWIQAHIYTVDQFLWFMAEHGYTLQRTRKRLPFCDVHATIERQKIIRAKAFKKMLAERRTHGAGM